MLTIIVLMCVCIYIYIYILVELTLWLYGRSCENYNKYLKMKQSEDPGINKENFFIKKKISESKSKSEREDIWFRKVQNREKVKGEEYVR